MQRKPTPAGPVRGHGFPRMPEAGVRLLIVHADPSTRQSIRTVFTRNGWRISEAATVAEAIAELHTPPDWLVLNVGFSDQESHRLIARLRAMKAATRVVLCVEPGNSDCLAELMALRPDLVLSRPIDTGALFQACQFLRGIPAAFDHLEPAVCCH